MKNTNRRLPRIILCLSTFGSDAGLLFSQVRRPPLSPEESKWPQIVRNTQAMTVSLSMDRQVYFPVEDAVITVRVTNPTSRALEVLKPLDRYSGSLYPSTQQFGNDGDPIAFHPGNAPVASTVIIQPGQEISASTRAYRPGEGLTSCEIPMRAGKHTLTYLYGPTARVEFTVAYPTIERCTSAEDPLLESNPEVIHTREGFKQTGKQLTRHIYTLTCAMKLDGRTLIGTGARSYYASAEVTELHARNGGWLGLRGMVRAVDSADDVELVGASHDADGGLSIAIRTAGGVKQVRLNKHMKVLPDEAIR